MDREIPAGISGNFSGNSGDHNVSGNNNNNIITGNQISFTYLGTPDQGREFRAGRQEESGIHRVIPYGRNRNFTGREELIESVKRLADRNGHNRIALQGLGGSGKTQIALEYLYQRESVGDRHVFWVQGSGIIKFSEGFRTIAQHVQIPRPSAETDEDEFLLSMKRWFQGPESGNWILVIDNADNEEDIICNSGPIAKFVPQGPSGTLIFTTRSRQVAIRQGCERIDVGKMEEEEARLLFSKRLGSWDTLGGEEEKVVTMILGSLHHVPLAIVGAAAFMTETETLPSAYWTIFRGSDERAKRLLSQPFCEIQRESDMTESILTTYFVTFNRIAQRMPLAADLLRIIAFFDCQNIPEELLSQCGLEGMDDPIEFRQAIGKLLAFSLVTAVKREDTTLYELHRLVQLSLQVYLPTEELGQWRRTALEVVSRLFPRCENKWRSVGPAYIPHALAVTKDLTDPIAEELSFRMGQYFLDMGSYNDAEIQSRRCITLRTEGKEYDWDDEGRKRFILLGALAAYQGKATEAEHMFRNLLEDIEKALGPDNPDVLRSVNYLAMVLRHQGKYDESERMNRHALDGYEKVLAPEHPNTLTCVSNLAEVLQRQGRYMESEATNQYALEMRAKIHGADHPDTLTSANNLALVLSRQDKHAELERVNRHALEGYEKVLGPDHPNTLSSVSNLAEALEHQEKYIESEKMSRPALEGRERVLGPDHPDTLLSVSNLGSALRGHGRYEESEEMDRRALEGRERVLGPDHPDPLESVNNIALVLEYQGKYAVSETMHRRVLQGYEKALGAEHPWTLTSVHNLANMLWSQGKYLESEAMNRCALEGH